MNAYDFDSKDGKARGSAPMEPVPIPGDPFPWEPEARPEHSPEESPRPTGETPSPADSADPTSFDLGGGD